ncbi:MAG: CRISPR-associated endonuclease Cas2 [Deltaproteobacteria bacterium]|nr:CRISPR-associated endonuclease Cas2 [Deltaproteobacteria bacterium]
MFCLVCFDIVADPARAKVVKVLKEYGGRVQKSVFECPDLSEGRFLKMKSRIEDLIDAGEDSVRYYVLCRSCLEKVEFTGIGRSPEKEVYRVV